MAVRFHRRVQNDLNGILEKYSAVSEQLSDDFWAEFQAGIMKARAHPQLFHFDSCGLRRCNLERFPYHFLYDLRSGLLRVWVVRHDHRNPSFGLRRFPAETGRPRLPPLPPPFPFIR